MFRKLAKFRMIPSRRFAPGVIAPANDNKRIVRRPEQRPAKPGRLVCHWVQVEGCPGLSCRWELEDRDGPYPSLRGEPSPRRTNHKTVLKLSSPGRFAGERLRSLACG